MELGETRRLRVAEMLQVTGAVTVTELQVRFGVSPMTARRDLTILAERGMALRTHGGAVLPSPASSEYSFRQRLRQAPEAGVRLAEAAFALIAPGETVFLDASPTSYRLSRLIAKGGTAVRVITNGLPVLQELAGSEHADTEVIAIGGMFRRLTCSYVGPVAVSSVRGHFADRLFMSVAGLSARGVMKDVDELDVEVKRAMLEQAEQAVLLLEDSKVPTLGRRAIAPVSAVSLVLADGLGPADAEWFAERGATLEVV